VLNRGRHLNSTGRPSRWALAHILVCDFFKWRLPLCFFGRPFVKQFALCYRSVVCLSCPVCLSVCDVRALWPNCWTDRDETWQAGRPGPSPHCLRWGPSSPPLKGHSPQFSAHICSGQMAAWIKMSLGMKLGLGPGDIVIIQRLFGQNNSRRQ